MYFEHSSFILAGDLRHRTSGQIKSYFETIKSTILFINSDLYAAFRNDLNFIDSRVHFYELIERISKSSELGIEEINSLVNLLELYHLVKGRFTESPVLAESMIDPETFKSIHARLIKPFRYFVSKEGDIEYEKHPLLRPLYHELRSLDSKIKKEINSFLKDPDKSRVLQFNNYDIINDIYVLPIRSDSYSTRIGKIIAKSETGHTLYVEPNAIRELSNIRMQKLYEIEFEISKICREICSEVFELIESIRSVSVFTYTLDTLVAKARYIEELALVEPEISDTPKMKIEGFFHPMIENPVKNDLCFDDTHAGLIISGPNTGGKTVSLKAISVCHLFINFGLFVPADYACLYPFENIFYLSHDQQNLAQGLSSFSSEVRNYLALVDQLGDSNLIVIDEIFNSTSSDEASALAVGLIHHIEEISNSRFIISTHHKLLKTHYHHDKRFLSGHVGYDQKNEVPNYKLNVGTPGSSFALKIFEKISKPFPDLYGIVGQAKTILSENLIKYEELLQSVTQRNFELEELLHENKVINQELINQKKEHEGVLKLQTRQYFERYKDKVDRLIERYNDSISQIKDGKVITVKEATVKFKDLKNEYSDLADTAYGEKKEQVKDLVSASEIKVGEQYFCKQIGKVVKVVNSNTRKKIATVLHGKIKVGVGFDQLFLTSTNINKIKPKFESFYPDTAPNMDIDCRGFRLEEFQRVVENSLNDLINESVTHLVVIHGHGDGILKGWLRKYLRKNPKFSWSAPEGFADGATRIEMKAGGDNS